MEASAPSSPLLIDDLLEQVLFRVLPDDPVTLVRAAVVCKRWRAIIHDDPGFRRRFREFHGAPPLLGVLCNSQYVAYKSRFYPTSSSCSRHSITSELSVADARHGRVLLHQDPWTSRWRFFLWDPVRDERRELPELRFVGFESSNKCAAAALCAATDGTCDHLHCQTGPFRVVFIRTASYERMSVHTYSSEFGLWRRHASSLQLPHRSFSFDTVPSLLLGNSTLRFVTHGSRSKILKYDLATRHASVIPGPSTNSRSPHPQVVLMTTEKAELGLASAEACRVHLWSWRQATNRLQADGGWELVRTIELPTVLPAKLVGFADNGVNRILFVRTSNVISALDLKSEKTSTICRNNGFFCVFPTWASIISK